jgi:hypothetical protein
MGMCLLSHCLETAVCLPTYCTAMAVLVHFKVSAQQRVYATKYYALPVSVKDCATGELVKSTEWPPNSPYLNPFGYHVWNELEQSKRTVSVARVTATKHQKCVAVHITRLDLISFRPIQKDGSDL